MKLDLLFLAHDYTGGRSLFIISIMIKNLETYKIGGFQAFNKARMSEECLGVATNQLRLFWFCT